MNNVDKQYLDLMRDVLENGTLKQTRSGEVLSVFGRTMRFNLKEGFPLLTTKKVFTKGIIHELLWFLKGDTNIHYLVKNGVHIWDDDAYRHYLSITKQCAGYESKSKEDFLQSVLNKDCIIIPGVGYYEFGDLGPIYGLQWRNFNGVNQIADVIQTLKTNPDDRRMIVSAYNPADIPEMALPPCHVMFQFYTRELDISERVIWAKENIDYNSVIHSHEALDNLNAPKRELSLSFMCRSQDLPLGTPYNIASYALLCHIIANICNMTVGDLVYFGGDVHVYVNQILSCNEQLQRVGYDKLPKLIINRRLNNVDDIQYDDIEIIDYKSDPVIKFPLSVGLNNQTHV